MPEMKITAIEPQRHRHDRVNLYVDGEFRLTLAREIVLRRGLARGDVVEPPLLAELDREDLQWRARGSALGLLSVRARSAAEVTRALREQGFPADVASGCVGELIDEGLVNDSRFAEALVDERVRLRPKGRRMLSRELRSRGVAGEIGRAAIEEVMNREGVTDLDLARQSLRKWRRKPGEESIRARRRLAAFLQRRGFGADTIRQILDEVDL